MAASDPASPGGPVASGRPFSDMVTVGPSARSRAVDPAAETVVRTGLGEHTVGALAAPPAGATVVPSESSRKAEATP